MSVEWADPPSKTGPGSFTDEVIAELKAHPGQWAVISKQTRYNSTAMQWAARHTGFEVTQRRVDGFINTYARYVGDAP